MRTRLKPRGVIGGQVTWMGRILTLAAKNAIGLIAMAVFVSIRTPTKPNASINY